VTVPLVANALTRSFDGDLAVDAVDLDVRFGEVHAVVGLNGAGKTTLMRLFLGMLRPEFGSVEVMGHDAVNAPANVWSEVGHLIEAPFAYPELTVAHNLAAAALLHGVDRDLIEREVERTIAEFELSRWSGHKARALSLGNRQRLGLASALIHRPDIVVLDEPANALDPAGVVFIRDLLRTLGTNGAAVLVSSHHLDELARIADRITVLHRGRIVGALEPEGVDLERRFFDLVYEVEMKTSGG